MSTTPTTARSHGDNNYDDEEVAVQRGVSVTPSGTTSHGSSTNDDDYDDEEVATVNNSHNGGITNNSAERTTTTSCQGDEDEEEGSGMDWICRCTWFMMALIVAGAICVAILLIQEKKAEADDGSTTSTASSTSPQGTGSLPGTPSGNGLLALDEYYEVLYQHLWQVRRVQGLGDPSTATYEALEWMAFQDGAVWQFLLDEQTLNVQAFEQRFALACFFFSTAGAEFWNSEWLAVGVPDCDFDGVRCNTHRQVTVISLHQRSLIGKIPPQLAWLTSLRRLELHTNRLTGSIPPELFTELRQLQYLDLSSNALTGSVPANWAYLTKLNQVTLQGNALTGPLPTALPILSLRQVNLNINQFTGTLPLREWHAQARLYDTLLHLPSSSVSNSTTTTTTTTTNTFTNGTLALEFLDVGRNPIQGSLDGSLLGTTLGKLQSLGMYQTLLTGTIPTEMGLLSDLHQLSLGDIKGMTGTFPTELFQLTHLEWLVLSSTKVSGNFSKEVANWSNMQVLNVVNTNWHGTLPTELGLLTDLEWLQLAHTDVEGTIPTELGRLSKLATLWLHGTSLQGSLPGEICSLPFVQEDLRVSCAGGSGPVKCSCCNYCYF